MNQEKQTCLPSSVLLFLLTGVVGLQKVFYIYQHLSSFPDCHEHVLIRMWATEGVRTQQQLDWCGIHILGRYLDLHQKSVAFASCTVSFSHNLLFSNKLYLWFYIFLSKIGLLDNQSFSFLIFFLPHIILEWLPTFLMTFLFLYPTRSSVVSLVTHRTFSWSSSRSLSVFSKGLKALPRSLISNSVAM